MSYSFPKDAVDGDVVALSNGVRYQYESAKDRWMVKSVVTPAACPKIEAEARQYKDYDNPKEQITITYYPAGQLPDSELIGFSEIRFCNFIAMPDASRMWLSISGNRHEVYMVSTIGGDPVWSFKSEEGDLTTYIGQTVEVHNCEEGE